MHVNARTGHPGFKKKLLSTAVSLSLLPLSGAALAQDDVVEEVIVESLDYQSLHGSGNNAI